MGQIQDGAHYVQEPQPIVRPVPLHRFLNMKLAANTLNKVLICPGETFSFWQLVRYADKDIQRISNLTTITI